MAYVGTDMFVNALPKRLVDDLVCEVKNEGMEAVRHFASIVAAMAVLCLDDGTDRAKATALSDFH